jgi:hypothetical protein
MSHTMYRDRISGLAVVLSRTLHKTLLGSAAEVVVVAVAVVVIVVVAVAGVLRN